MVVGFKTKLQISSLFSNGLQGYLRDTVGGRVRRVNPQIREELRFQNTDALEKHCEGELIAKDKHEWTVCR